MYEQYEFLQLPPGSEKHFQECLRESIKTSEQHADDIGPTDRLSQEALGYEYQSFFGGTSPLTSPSPSPPPSRSASPTLDYGCSLASLPPLASSSPTAIVEEIDNCGQPERKGSSRTNRNKAKSKSNRKRGRKETYQANRSKPYEVRTKVEKKYVEGVDTIATTYGAEKLETASTGYVGKAGRGGPTSRVDALKAKGIDVKKWDAKKPLVIHDSSGRILAVFVNGPDDIKWEVVHRGAMNAVRVARDKCQFPRKIRKHRRGSFPALNKGVSHGGGSKKPGNLYHDKRNAAVLADLVKNEYVTRISGHANSAFATWAPKMYTHFEENFEQVLNADDSLIRNFDNSVWAAFAVNFGPRTVCNRHRDSANLPYGWCAIAALGDFDYEAGGHLILWEFKIAVEFPPGSIALIPSASITHSNAPIGRHEFRYSLAQFSAGGLFRWADQDFQRTEDYKASLMPEETAEELRMQEERCKFGLSLFSTISSLKDDQAVRRCRA